MSAQRFGKYGAAGNGEHLDNIELLNTVDSLRRDILSMSSEIKDVLSENDQLHKEIDRLKKVRRDTPVSAAQRIKGEVDELIRLHQMASYGKARTNIKPRRRTQLEEDHPTDRSDWMKKMMMFMMMAEMV